LSRRSKTLHYGLKLNQERNSAVAHPLMFMVRRILYAIVIVCMGQSKVVPVFIVMLCSLAMLVYALSER